MNRDLTRELTAEFIGTFMLVLIGAGSVVVSPPSIGALGPALAHGLILVSIIATYGHISGAHVNPAVTLGILVGGHMKAEKAGYYMLAQFLGGIVAAIFLLVILDPNAGAVGQTTAASGVNSLQIILVEFLGTFFLVSTVYQVAVYGKGGQLTPVLLGLTLVGLILFGGPLTGAAYNPARLLGPAIFGDPRQDIPEVLVYLVAIFGGGAVAGILQNDTFKIEAPTEENKGKRTRR